MLLLGKQGWCGGENSRFAPVLPWLQNRTQGGFSMDTLIFNFLKFDQEW